MNVGYLGPRGTFTEQAARRIFAGQDVHWIPYRTIPEILFDVEKGAIERGVVPIENAIEGSVALTLDVLVHEVDVPITAEYVLPVAHCLLVKPGAKIEAIRSVHSHPQALAQCRQSLDKVLPGAVQRAATSTAEAAQLVAESDGTMAAIGTSLAASLYGLEIAATDLQDYGGNATRFVAVGRKSPDRSGHDKTSIVFAFGTDKPGNLYGVLKVFAQAHINLTKLESRPAKQSLGSYIFLVDMEGHTSDPAVAKALDEVREACTFFKLLGSYPRVDYAPTLQNGL